MFAYISWYTVALLWIFRMEKKMRKMQCYTEYIQGCTQHKSVCTDTRHYIHRWDLYIWVYTHMSKYRIVYTLMNALYLRTSPYIRVFTRMWHFAKACMTRRFELGISCILQGWSDHYVTSVDTKVCIVWYMSAKLRLKFEPRCSDFNIITAHSHRNRTVVALVDQDILKMEGTSGLSLEPYLWRQHSIQVQICRPNNVAVELWAACGRCQCCQWLCYCNEEAAFGEPCSCRHNNTLICSWPSVSCCCNECAAFECAARPQGAGGPAGCRRAGRAQAKKAVAHRMCSDVRVCTSMCPLNQDKKSAVKVYTLAGMYSVHASIYFIWEFHTEIYGHLLSYNSISRHILLVKVYLRIYADILLATVALAIVHVEIYWVYYPEIYDFLDFHTELYSSIV
jgi:hypothetical protein